MLRKALQYQRLCGGVLALHEEDPTLSRGGAHERGRRQRGARHRRDPDGRGVDDGRARRRARGLRGRARALPAPQLRAPRSTAVGRRQGARLAGQRGGHAAPPAADRGGRARAGHAHEDAPAAAHRGRPPALVEGLRDGTIDCVATDHAPHAREEKEVPFEQAPMGTTGLETAFAALYTGLVLPGVLELGAARRADDRRRGAVRACRRRVIAVGRAGQPRAARPRRRVGRRRARLGEPLGELLLRRARAARAACC